MEGDKASCHICRPEPPRREAETCKEDEKGYCLTHTAYCRPPDPSASQQRREAEQAVLKAAKLWRMAPGWHTRNELERAVDAMTAALTPRRARRRRESQQVYAAGRQVLESRHEDRFLLGVEWCLPPERIRANLPPLTRRGRGEGVCSPIVQ
jgi:hypothetical protein